MKQPVGVKNIQTKSLSLFLSRGGTRGQSTASFWSPAHRSKAHNDWTAGRGHFLLSDSPSNCVSTSFLHFLFPSWVFVFLPLDSSAWAPVQHVCSASNPWSSPQIQELFTHQAFVLIWQWSLIICQWSAGSWFCPTLIKPFSLSGRQRPTSSLKAQLVHTKERKSSQG